MAPQLLQELVLKLLQLGVPEETGVIKSEMGGINEDGMYDR
jgi:hypothetical protein